MVGTSAIILALLSGIATVTDDPPTTATKLNNQAMVLFEQGRLQDAEESFRSALAMKCGELVRAKIATNLALLYRRQDRYPEAEQALRHALEWRQRNLPPASAEIAYSFNNLADVYRIEGRDWEARNLLEAAVRILRKSHPDSAGLPVIAGNFAVMLFRFHEYNQSEALFREALAGSEARYGVMSREVGVVSNNLAQVLQAKKDFPEAAAMYARAVHTLESLGPEAAPDLAAALANTGHLLEWQHQSGQAREAEQRALDLLGPQGNAPLRAVILENLGNIVSDSANPAGALPYFEQSLDIQEKVLGAEHPATVRLLLDYAEATLRAGQKSLARKLRKRAQQLISRIETTAPSQFTVSLNSLRDAR